MFGKELRKEFPIFENYKNEYGSDLVYFDSGATTQKPQSVITSISDYYSKYNSNVSRSAHALAERATDAYEGVRTKVAKLINASDDEIIFTKNSTESLNIVANSWGMSNITAQDTIVTMVSEHNSSLLPWKLVQKSKNATIEYINVDLEGQIEKNWRDKITSETKVVVLTHVSNVLGTITNIKEMAKYAKSRGAVVVVDGSQAIGHINVNVKSLNIDFYAFSAHKVFGPTGVGILWGRKELLQDMHPQMLGGGTVLRPEVDVLKDIPHRFEAGTPNIAGIVGLGAAIDFLNQYKMDEIHTYLSDISNYAYERLQEVPNIKLIGPKKDRSDLVSFYIPGTHSHDIASILSTKHVAIRAGMHCAMQFHLNLEVPATSRMSFHIYNDKEEVDYSISVLKDSLKVLL